MVPHRRAVMLPQQLDLATVENAHLAQRLDRSRSAGALTVAVDDFYGNPQPALHDADAVVPFRAPLAHQAPLLRPGAKHLGSPPPPPPRTPAPPTPHPN